MVSTWIESSAKGRHGGPVRSGLWSSVVIGTHPIEQDQAVTLEISADDDPVESLPGYWLENKGGNSLWQVPIPPFSVGARLRYRGIARGRDGGVVSSPPMESLVRPNLPDRSDLGGGLPTGAEGLVGNRRMTVRVDPRGSTYDVYFPTVALHSDVRPAEGDRPESRSHFRAIVGGLAVGPRLDWFSERMAWESSQRYLGTTNILRTDLRWRHGPIRVLVADLVATEATLPRTVGGALSPGQYLKRYRVINEGAEPRRALFGIYVKAEINGGIGEPGLSWLDDARALLASNRGHAHSNRKLARDSTVEFALALDRAENVFCETTGPDEAIILSWIDLPAGGSIGVDLLVSGAFTGWRGDPGTFDHWLKPAIDWFRSSRLDDVEAATARSWGEFVAPLPSIEFPKSDYGNAMRRSALAASLHADADWGSIAGGFHRGLDAYCWPRDALWTAEALGRAGHPEYARAMIRWMGRVINPRRGYSYWCQKYSMDGSPEWETPAVDPPATMLWALERLHRRTGDEEIVRECWPTVEQAARVCMGEASHPGLRRVDHLALISSAGIWDHRFGAFAYSNAALVAGLRAAARLGRRIGQDRAADGWDLFAEQVWEIGVLGHVGRSESEPGLFDAASGRLLEARRMSRRRGLWTDQAAGIADRGRGSDVSMLGLAVPFGLLPAADARVRRTAEAILRQNGVDGPDAFACWSPDPARPEDSVSPGDHLIHDVSSLATLWVARYLLQLGHETGEGRHWTRAVAIVDGLMDRLGPLGLVLRNRPRRDDPAAPRASGTSGVWGLHAMLIEVLLDLAGLEYDASARFATIEPKLPPSWSTLGSTLPFADGTIRYQLTRSEGQPALTLVVDADLRRPVSLSATIVCPTLVSLGPWTSRPSSPPPTFDRARRRVTWTTELPVGESRQSWSWG